MTYFNKLTGQKIIKFSFVCSFHYEIVTFIKMTGQIIFPYFDPWVVVYLFPAKVFQYPYMSWILVPTPPLRGLITNTTFLVINCFLYKHSRFQTFPGNRVGPNLEKPVKPGNLGIFQKTLGNSGKLRENAIKFHSLRETQGTKYLVLRFFVLLCCILIMFLE